MTIGVLVMAYGTPASRDAIEAFYLDVRRGRPPTKEQLDELIGRYDAIGGVSPLNQRTTAQIEALAASLDELAPGRFRTFYGAKHTDPKIEDAVGSIAEAGCSGLIGVVLAPHFSTMSVGEYVERAAATAAGLGLPARFIEQWHEEPALHAALAARIHDALGRLSEDERANATVLFTAHSLPVRILGRDDPYPAQLAASARAIAELAGLTRWGTGWQSAGRTSEPWLGPDVADAIDELAAEGASAVVVCPQGFTSDHLEVLYDLDVLATERAARAGIGFARTESLNAEPSVFAALAARIAEAAEHLGEQR